MTDASKAGWRAGFAPSRALADLLGKRWMEPIVPFVVMMVVVLYFQGTTTGFLSSNNIANLEQDLALIGLLALAMGGTIIVGGIDISVVGTYGLLNFVVLDLIKVEGVGVLPAIGIVLVLGLAIGLFNGVVIAYFNTRPFLMTLVTLVILRSLLNILSQSKNDSLAVAPPIDSALWTFLSQGTVAGLQASVAILVVIALICHVLLSRARIGAHIVATGASRRGAQNAGINIRRMSLGMYVLGGLLAALAAVLQAARLESGSNRVGDELEFGILTALILGGISLGGGRGTVARAMIGAVIIGVISNGISLSSVNGYVYPVTIAVVLIFAVVVDQKWSKNRGKAIAKISLDPGRMDLPARPPLAAGTGGLYEQNRRLEGSQAIGLGIVEGPEDCIVDTEGRVYCGDRRGWIWRFSGENYETSEIFSRVGGAPLGLAFAPDGDLVVCAGGRGVFRISPEGVPTLVADLTSRTRFSLVDDSRLRLVDDVDISPDGRIWFSEATKRFEMHDWILDILEARPNGRVLCHDPRTGKTRTVLNNMRFPNGVCVTHDKQSILVASWSSSLVHRYWIDGPREGDVEVVLEGLPGYCDNINRSGDGNYWLAFAGVRNPAFDLALKMPGFRRRMVKALPPDDWMFPNVNSSFVIKFTEAGEILDVLWDQDQTKHAVTTSMREFKGSLFLGGLTNNRVGRIDLPPLEQHCDCGQPPCSGYAEELASTSPTKARA